MLSGGLFSLNFEEWLCAAWQRRKSATLVQHASVAQGIEHRSPKAGVDGSNPPGGTRRLWRRRESGAVSGLWELPTDSDRRRPRHQFSVLSFSADSAMSCPQFGEGEEYELIGGDQPL